MLLYDYRFTIFRLNARANSIVLGCTIGLDKRGYQANNFLISRQKHTLVVLIRSL